MSMIKKNFPEVNQDNTNQKDGQVTSAKELYKDIISCIKEKKNVSSNVTVLL